MFSLDRSLLPAANQFLADLDTQWRAATGLNNRADYSINYSPICPCPLMVLGLNPGGSADNFKLVDVAAGGSEYIEGYGPTSQNIGRLLQRALGVSSPEGIRTVQGSNVIWRRSPNMQSLGIRVPVAAKETAPHLARLISYIGPRAILFGGKAAYDAFLGAHKARVVTQGETILGPNGSSQAVYFGHSALSLPYLSGNVEAFIVLHPSKGLRDPAVNWLKFHFARLFAA
jgi:hypothetical protein